MRNHLSEDDDGLPQCTEVEAVVPDSADCAQRRRHGAALSDREERLDLRTTSNTIALFGSPLSRTRMSPPRARIAPTSTGGW
jgi:hypothetical protein